MCSLCLDMFSKALCAKSPFLDASQTSKLNVLSTISSPEQDPITAAAQFYTPKTAHFLKALCSSILIVGPLSANKGHEKNKH